MTVLVGGLRVLNANTGRSDGVLTKQSEMLTNDFFVNLLDMNTTWQPSSHDPELFDARDATSGAVKWTAAEQTLSLVQTPFFVRLQRSMPVVMLELNSFMTLFLLGTR